MGNRIKEYRRALGLTQGDLATRIGTSRSQLVKLERGERRLSDVWLEKLAPALGVAQGALLGDSAPDATIYLDVQGKLSGEGNLTPLDEDDPLARVACPRDAKKARGLSAYLMGDQSMSREIPMGTTLIVGDPRILTYPIVPGILLVFRLSDKTYIRQFVRDEAGSAWLVACPERPLPTLKAFAFEPKPNIDTETRPADAVNMSDIIGAVMWEHRRRIN